jgi:hypothetical protein
MTREELEAQLKEREAVLLKKEGTEPPTLAISPDAPAPKTEEVQVPDEKPVTPDPQANSAAMDELKAKLAASESRQADLQARLDRQSGEFGGNLDKLRNQLKEISDAYASLKGQYDALLAKPQQAPAAPAKVVSDDLRAAFPEAADAIEQTIAALKAQVAEVAKVGEEGRSKADRAAQSAMQLAEARFSEKLYGAVPDFDALNLTPEWKQYVMNTAKDGEVLVNRLNSAWGTDAGPIIDAVNAFKALTVKAPAADKVADKAKADADKAAKLKAESSPTQAAGANKTDSTPANDAIKARQERIASYKAKSARDFTSVTQKEMDQFKADSDEELKHKLSLAGYQQ